MKRNILLYGPMADAARSRVLRIQTAEITTAGELLRCIALQQPRLGNLLAGARLAVNCRFVGADHPLRESDELALIGQVSGG